jgi:hypothetical protein
MRRKIARQRAADVRLSKERDGKMERRGKYIERARAKQDKLRTKMSAEADASAQKQLQQLLAGAFGPPARALLRLHCKLPAGILSPCALACATEHLWWLRGRRGRLSQLPVL